MLKHLILIATMLTPAAALGQGWSLGALGIMGPSYKGGDIDQVTLIPFVQYETGPWTFGGRNLVTYQIGLDEGFRTELALGFDMGQDDAAAPKVDLAATAVAKIAYRHPYFEIASTLTNRLFADQGGTTVKLEVGTGYPLADRWFLAAGLAATYADGAYRQSYYGVNTDGWESTQLSVANILSVSENWSALVGLTYTRLDADLRDLPHITTPDGISLTLGATYTF